MERAQDLSISGMGKMGGGKYNDVDISGMGKIMGDLEAERVTISGKGTIEGNATASGKVVISGMGTITGSIKTDQLNSSGTGSVEGNLEARIMECSGNFKIGGEAKVDELDVDGRCRVGGSLRAEKIVSHGLLSIGGDLEAEEFLSQGSFSVEGLLNANKMDIVIHGYCQARELGGEEIRVRSGKNSLNIPLISKLINPFLGNGRELDKLTAEQIEGTVVSLESTKAKVVRGNQVKIGPDCIIDEIEYTDSAEVDPRSTVKKLNKI